MRGERLDYPRPDGNYVRWSVAIYHIVVDQKEHSKLGMGVFDCFFV